MNSRNSANSNSGNEEQKNLQGLQGQGSGSSAEREETKQQKNDLADSGVYEPPTQIVEDIITPPLGYTERSHATSNSAFNVSDDDYAQFPKQTAEKRTDGN